MNSLSIILNLYKKESITEEEAIHLIEDLQRNNNFVYPITYLTTIEHIPSSPYYKPFEVTC